MATIQQQGLLLIPDISGFTEFVTEVEISHSEHIITELLELLINTDSLDLNLCEIEGDALFFYKGGPVPSLDSLIDQTRLWYLTFHSHLNLLRRDTLCKCGACQNLGNLGLKVVGHRGDFAVYNLKNKIKIIGKDVIVVHRLLKNTVDKREYFMLTDAVTEAAGLENQDGWDFQAHRETYEVLGEVATNFVDLAPLQADLPPTPPHDEIPTLDGSFHEEIEINADLEKVAGVLADVPGWTNWVAGLVTQKMDFSAPIKPGHHHICVFPDMDLPVTIQQLLQEKDEFRMVETLGTPPHLRELVMVLRAVKTGEKTVKVEERFIYSRKPILGRIFEIKAIPRLRAQSKQSLLNLKALIEEGKKPSES